MTITTTPTFLSVDELAVVGIGLGFGGKALVHVFHAGRFQIAEGYDLGVGGLFEGWDVRFAAIAESDDADLNRFWGLGIQ